MSFYPCNRGSVKAIYDPVFNSTQTDGLTFTWITLCQFEQRKKGEKG